MSTINPSVTKTAIPKTPATKSDRKPATTNQGATILKTTLVVSSIVATLVGANLLARQDQTIATTPVMTTAYAAVAEHKPPQPFAAIPNLPDATTLDASDVNSLLNMPLAPIPSISIPAPVTRSRSSR